MVLVAGVRWAVRGGIAPFSAARRLSRYFAKPS